MNNWIYVVEDLVAKVTGEVHACLLKLYSDACLNVDEDLYDQVAHDGAGYEVDEFLDLRKRGSQWHVQRCGEVGLPVMRPGNR